MGGESWRLAFLPFRIAFLFARRGPNRPTTRRQKRQAPASATLRRGREAFCRRERLPLLRPASEAARFGGQPKRGRGGHRGRRPSPHGDAHQWRGADAPSPRGAVGGTGGRLGGGFLGHLLDEVGSSYAVVRPLFFCRGSAKEKCLGVVPRRFALGTKPGQTDWTP